MVSAGIGCIDSLSWFITYEGYCKHDISDKDTKFPVVGPHLDGIMVCWRC